VERKVGGQVVDNADVYSDYKILHHTDRINQVIKGEQVVPVMIFLNLSDLCNHDCSFCSFRMSGYPNNQKFATGTMAKFGTNNPNRMITTDKALEIIKDISLLGCKSIVFTGGGEPTVHPDHHKLFEHALDNGLECGLVTNGHLLNEKTIKTLNRFKWIRVSIESSDPKVYSSIHRVNEAAFDKIVNNISLLVQHKSNVGMNYVITEDNCSHDQILNFAQMGLNLGVKHIRFAFCLTPKLQSFYSDYDSIVESISIARSKYQSDNYTVYDNFVTRKDNVSHQPNYSHCYMQEFTPNIGADLNVYRCCTLSYNDRGLMGSISNMRFYDFWNSKLKEESVSAFDPTGCKICPVNSKNLLLNKIRDTDDINFL